MDIAKFGKASLKWLGIGSAVAVGAYGAYVGTAWCRYGHPRRPRHIEEDPLLDRFMPEYEVVDRHKVRVNAPAEVALAAASEMDLNQSAIVRVVFKTREKILHSGPAKSLPAGGMVAQTKALGWGTLAKIPGREIVMGAVTQPWAANIVFRSISPEAFAAFDEPGYVKIVWTLRADPISETESIFRTETRAIATDSTARARFRPYWSFLSPGIILIRRIMIGTLRREVARRRAQSL